MQKHCSDHFTTWSGQHQTQTRGAKLEEVADDAGSRFPLARRKRRKKFSRRPEEEERGLLLSRPPEKAMVAAEAAARTPTESSSPSEYEEAKDKVLILSSGRGAGRRG